MSFSDFLELEILDHIFGGATGGNVYTPPATLYVGLSSTDPGEAGAGITAPSGGAYARVSVTNTTTNWTAAAAGAKTNATVISFLPASADWLAGVDIGFFTIHDAASGGNFLGSGALTVPKPVLNGDTASFAIAAVTISLT